MNTNTITPTTPPVAVQARSLPWSLRHCSPHDALNEARDLATFLCEVSTARRMDDADPEDISLGDWKNGLFLCFGLLVDKLDIAAGAYKFPTLTHDSNAPRLCEREVGGDHE